MYRQDSFFDLSGWGQLGLLVISLVLLAVMAILARRLLRGYRIWVRAVGGVALFWLFVWVSPQLYYTYYLTIFPNLPVQWVIWPIREPLKAFEMLIFSYRPNLSAHGQGILGWVTIFAAVWPHKPVSTES